MGRGNGDFFTDKQVGVMETPEWGSGGGLVSVMAHQRLHRGLGLLLGSCYLLGSGQESGDRMK